MPNDDFYDELTRLNNELVNLQRELAKKNSELEQLNKLKDQFLGIAAHDLRKPVSAILSYTETLLDETEDQLGNEHYGFLKTVHKSTGLMRTVIDDFLDVSMIESGNLKLDLTHTDVSEPASYSIELNQMLAKKKDVTLRSEVRGKLPVQSIDAMKIEQVFNNLITNAIEHTPEGSEIVVILDATGDSVAITVADSGPGIPAEEMATLFTPFVTAKRKRRLGSKSMGLGLAISKKIVEAHGGAISAKNSPDGGALFTITLPFEMGKEIGER